MFKKTERNKAWRRSQNKRIEKKVYKYLKNFDYHYCFLNDNVNKDEKNKYLMEKVRKEKNNMTLCSCFSCGNPRKWNGEITLKEKIFKDVEKSQDI